MISSENHSLTPYDSYCVLRHGSTWFALAALSVREIAPPVRCVSVPAAPPLVAGLGHLRNEFLVVLRCDAVAGEPAAKRYEDQQVLVLQGPGGVWGLLVDEVAGLASLEISIKSESKDADGWTATILGSATYQDKVVRVLDVNALYRFAEHELTEGWSTLNSRSENADGRSSDRHSMQGDLR